MGYSSKENFYNIIKVLLCIIVVIGHVLSGYTGDGNFSPVGRVEWMTYIRTIIYSFHMPAFMFITGAVYGACLQKGKYKKTGLFIQNKIKRILTPYLLWGGILTPVMMFCKLTDMGAIEYYFKNIILSISPIHLWYLLALFWIYCLVRALDKIQNMGIKLLVSCALYLFGIYLNGKFNYFQISAALLYQLYFVVGMAFDKYYNRFEKFEKYLSIRNMAVVFTLSLLLLGLQPLLPENFVINFGFRTVGIIFLFSLAKLLSDMTKIIDNPLFNHVLTDSYGIYLLHPMIIYIEFYVLGQFSQMPVAFSVFCFFTSFLVADLISCVLRRTKLKFML
ncbi:MAG: acyltransferase [Oscillospiraceae bacterium]|nr:acyltransferase [Oscillospiraceae bacterium]